MRGLPGLPRNIDAALRPCYASSVPWFDSSIMELHNRPVSVWVTPGKDEVCWKPDRCAELLAGSEYPTGESFTSWFVRRASLVEELATM
jgi:hypothetical protein